MGDVTTNERAARKLARRQARLDRRQVFICAGCEQETPWSQGAADDLPDHCDGCWWAVEALARGLGRMWFACGGEVGHG